MSREGIGFRPTMIVEAPSGVPGRSVDKESTKDWRDLFAAAQELAHPTEQGKFDRARETMRVGFLDRFVQEVGGEYLAGTINGNETPKGVVEFMGKRIKNFDQVLDTEESLPDGGTKTRVGEFIEKFGQTIMLATANRPEELRGKSKTLVGLDRWVQNQKVEITEEPEVKKTARDKNNQPLIIDYDRIGAAVGVVVGKELNRTIRELFGKSDNSEELEQLKRSVKDVNNGRKEW